MSAKVYRRDPIGSPGANPTLTHWPSNRRHGMSACGRVALYGPGEDPADHVGGFNGTRCTSTGCGTRWRLFDAARKDGAA